MSKNTNDGLTRSDTGCFTVVPMATVGTKGFNQLSVIYSLADLGFRRVQLC